MTDRDNQEMFFCILNIQNTSKRAIIVWKLNIHSLLFSYFYMNCLFSQSVTFLANENTWSI